MENRTPLLLTQSGPPCFFHRYRRTLLRAAFIAVLSASTLGTSAAAADSAPTAEEQAAESKAQRIFATRSYLQQLHRIQLVVYELMKAATPYCDNQRKYSVGIPAISAEDLPADLQRGFTELTGTGPTTRHILNLSYYSPLKRAGAKEGDIVLSMIDRTTGAPAFQGWALQRPGSSLVTNESVVMNVQRDGVRQELNVRPQLICDVRLRLVRAHAPILNIKSGGITLSTGLLAFAPNDSELAVLLANEFIREQLAHQKRAEPRTAAANHGHTVLQSDEYMADYLSSYLAVAAYFDLDRGNTIWKRLASDIDGPLKGKLASKHALSAQRAITLRAIEDEIRRKQKSGQRIIPEKTELNFSVVQAEARADETLATSDKAAVKPNSDSDQNKLRFAGDIPFIDSEGRAGYQRFLDSPLRPRAFAIGPSKISRGAWAFRYGANAAADALAYCATLARGPCYLYAIDDQVVWNPETVWAQPEMGQAQRSETSVGLPSPSGYAAIDDISAVPLKQADLPRYRAFLEKPSPRAFVITEGGLGRYWVGPASVHDALAFCGRTHDYCWLYAINDRVVWSKEPAKRISSTEQLPPADAESGLLN